MHAAKLVKRAPSRERQDSSCVQNASRKAARTSDGATPCSNAVELDAGDEDDAEPLEPPVEPAWATRLELSGEQPNKEKMAKHESEEVHCVIMA